MLQASFLLNQLRHLSMSILSTSGLRRVGQNFPLCQPRKIIQLPHPLLHMLCKARKRLKFSKVQMGGDDRSSSCRVVLCYRGGVAEGEALDDVFVEPFGGPPSKLGALEGDTETARISPGIGPLVFHFFT